MNNDAQPIIKDVLQGDDQLAKSKLFESLDYKEIQTGLSMIFGNPNLSDRDKLSLSNNLWKINFEVKPPTMAEFLTPKYIGASADTLYDHVRDILIDFMNPSVNNEKRVLALSTAIGWGKSSLAVFIVLYIFVCLSYMRDAKKYFGLSQVGSLVAVLMSFTLKKANQLLVQPFMNATKASPLFHATRTEDGLIKKQKELEHGHIAYTTAGRLGALQLYKDIHLTVLSDRASLLGMNVIVGVASEISFWLSKGVSIEDIWGAFSDLRGRIFTRFGTAFYTATILDSSPIDLDLSPIDKWLYTPGEADSDPEVTIINAKHWDVFPEKYPEWQKTGKIFPVFRGNSAKGPRLIEDSERKLFGADEIYDVPIDIHLKFKQNVKKYVADFCAYPAGGLSKLFDSMEYVENIFTDLLKNQYQPINIPEEKNPKRLIWDQIVDKFFISLGGNKYEFYRSPNETRTIHIDLSETRDISSVTMSHKELNLKGEEIIVHDFNIPLQKGDSRINIDAVCEFILDLKNLGGIKLFKVTADQYQSAAILQRFKRDGIDAEKLSVDRETAPYLLYTSLIKNDRVKAGKSIHLKNNLKSLVEVISEKGNKKIDHIQGDPIYEDSGNWNTSQVGYRAKDVSDTGCGSAYTLLTEYKEKPIYIFDNSEGMDKFENRKNKFLKTLHQNQSLRQRPKP